MSDRTKTHFTNRLSVHITPAMSDRLDQLAIQRDMPKAETAREALRSYLDDQEDVISSRKHFTKRFQKRIDYLETILSIIFTLNLNTYTYLRNHIVQEGIDEYEILIDLLEGAVKSEPTFHELIEQAKQKPSK